MKPLDEAIEREPGRCLRCLARVAPGARRCDACGEWLADLGNGHTQEDDPAPADARPAGDALTGRLDSGAMVLGRYRIESTLGAGGMGTVYRAHDLQLGQTVALKFLDAALARKRAHVELLRNEVRLAREISHPNVCRVHDIGELEDRPFLSMEYIDGENLKTLLRRAGRLSGERAHQIARQLCAGLFAAHRKGVVHRDLKPANIMIDDDGNVRITDFGIAARVDMDTDTQAGTPAYMAPELFDGAPASQSSDLYALGCVLHELYTGSATHDAHSLTDLVAQRQRPITGLTDRLPDIDPQLEQIILACLDPRPAARPPSAMAVLAALPGGDPLAESLRAGATPTPDLIAAAGATCHTPPAAVAAMVAAIALVIALLIALDGRVKLLHEVDLPLSAPVLADRARALLEALHIDTRGVHQAAGFELDRARIDRIGATHPDAEQWQQRLTDADAPPITFVYRQAPPAVGLDASNLRGRVSSTDPAPSAPGTVVVRTDPGGRLIELLAIPTARAVAGDGAPTLPDLAPLMAAAGIDQAALSTLPPRRIPPVFADTRWAWHADPALDVDAAAQNGHPVSFVVSRQAPIATAEPAMRKRAWTQIGQVALILAALSLAWRTYAARRGDLRGAIRIGALVIALVITFTLLTGDHGGDWTGIVRLALKGMTHGAAVGLLLGLYYFAIEPYARQVWPQSMVGWERALRGQWLDARVGRDLLAGLLVGLLATLALALERWLPGIAGRPLGPPVLMHASSMRILDGTLSAFGVFLEIAVDMAREGFKFFTSVVVLRLLLGRHLPALIVAAMLWALAWHWAGNVDDLATQIASFLVALSIAAGLALLLARAGFFALIAAFITTGVFINFPLRLDLAHWMASQSLLALALGAAATAFGAAATLGHRLPGIANASSRH